MVMLEKLFGIFRPRGFQAHSLAFLDVLLTHSTGDLLERHGLRNSYV